MELRELDAFVRVVRLGSFTRAAEDMNTQKAHVSRVISSLEAKLGVRLLERSTRSLHLTEIGQEIFERAVGILGEVQEAERAAHQTLGEPRGTLKLTCGVEFGLVAASSWIRSYLVRYPQVAVEAHFTYRSVDIVNEGYDLAIRVGDLEESRLTSRALGTLSFGLYASPAYVAARGYPTHPDRLNDFDLLHFAVSGTDNNWRLVSEGEECRVTPSSRFRANSNFSMCDAAVAGLGIAKLAQFVAAEAVRTRRLVPVLPLWQHPALPVSAVYASSRYLTPKVRAFIDHALAHPDWQPVQSYGQDGV